MECRFKFELQHLPGILSKAKKVVEMLDLEMVHNFLAIPTETSVLFIIGLMESPLGAVEPCLVKTNPTNINWFLSCPSMEMNLTFIQTLLMWHFVSHKATKGSK